MGKAQRAQMAFLPGEYGKWGIAHKRFKRRADKEYMADDFQYACGRCRME